MPTEELTRREREIYSLAVTGLTNKAIASALFIEESTVKSHMSQVLAKTGAKTRSALIATAVATSEDEPRPRRTHRMLAISAAIATVYALWFLIPQGPQIAWEPYWQLSLRPWAIAALGLGVLFAAVRDRLDLVVAFALCQIGVQAVSLIVLVARIPVQFPATLFISSPVDIAINLSFAVVFIALARRAMSPATESVPAPN